MNTLIRLLGCILLCSVLAACATQGKPGMPLPPPNKEIGKKWPPEVREFVDVMLTMFVRGKSTPSDEDIEQALKARFVPTGLADSDVETEKAIQSWSLGGAANLSGSSYVKMIPHQNRRQFVALSLRVDPKRYCINPYDFAIYTGHRFMPGLGSYWTDAPLPEGPHDAQGNPYLFDYVWGMFSRAPNQLYKSTGEETISLSDDNRCIEIFEMSTSFQAPENYQGRRMP